LKMADVMDVRLYNPAALALPARQHRADTPC
jgi:hypothetical protein